MITFGRYEVRTEPEAVPFLIYAPNWKEAEESQEYQNFLAERNPRKVQITEQKYGYIGIAFDREATFKEAKELKDSEALEHLGTDVFYKYYGNKESMYLLTAKLTDEHNQKMSEWEKLYHQDMKSFLEKIKDICIAETVFDNLVLKGESYTPEYIEQLAALEKPLAEISEAYADLKEFNIRNDVQIAHIRAREEVMEDFYDQVRNPKAKKGQSEEERLQVLRESIEREFKDFEMAWGEMEFADKVGSCMDIFTVHQLYLDLKEHMSEYPPTMIYCLGAFEYPLSYDIESVVGMRVERMKDEKELSDAFAKLFPDVALEVDPWEIWDIRQKAGFNLKTGTELEYKALEELNSKDGYGLGAFEYLKRWAAGMEEEMERGLPLKEIALSTSRSADTKGITGAMYGYAVAVLSKFWEHGDCLREWHNQKYSYSGPKIVSSVSAVLETKIPEEPESISPMMSM